MYLSLSSLTATQVEEHGTVRRLRLHGPLTFCSALSGCVVCLRRVMLRRKNAHERHQSNEGGFTGLSYNGAIPTIVRCIGRL